MDGMVTAVIMAGGKGTRLRHLADDIPKPMFRILGKPVLEYQIESLKKGGITDIVLIIGHLGEAIRDYFMDGSGFGVRIRYIVEDEPLGTAGSLYYLKETVRGDFFLIFGDLILDIDWARFLGFHRKERAAVTLFAHPNTHPYDSDLIVADADGKVIKIEPKNEGRDSCYHNLVNAGVYCVNARLLDSIQEPIRADFEKDMVAAHISDGSVFAYRSTEYVKDMGTSDRLRAVSGDVEKGVVESRNLRNKQKAVFLDRDGTVNVLKGFLRSAEDMELYPGAAEAIRKINESGYLAIIATNQPVVARGECSLEELDRIHGRMEAELGKTGAYVDGLFFCPHHPDRGFAGEVAELKIDCGCRKPKTGMLQDAAEKYNIDLKNSWYVGDSTADIQTGINAHMKTALVKTGMAGMDGKYAVAADIEAEDLLGAVSLILQD